MVEDINLQLQEMGTDIKSVIDRVNQANANQDENSPVSEFVCVCVCVVRQTACHWIWRKGAWFGFEYYLF